MKISLSSSNRPLQVLVAIFLSLSSSAAFAAVSVNKGFSPTTITATGTSTLTITLGNSGGAAASAATLTDSLPSGVTIANPSNVITTCGGTATAAAGGSTVALTGGTIPPNNGTCTVKVSVTASATGSYVNTIAAGALTSSQGSNSQAASATLSVASILPVTGSVAYTLSRLQGNGPASGATITLNNANTFALTGVGTTFTLPAQMTFAAPVTATSTCGGTVTLNAGAGTGTLSGGTIPANGSCTIQFNIVAATPNNAFANQASIQIATGNLTSTQGVTNSGISDPLTVLTGAAVLKSFSPTSVVSGATSTLTISLHNYDVSTASPVSITDSLPAGMTVAATPNASTTCSGLTVTAAAGGSSIQLSGGTLAAGPTSSPYNSTCTVSVDVVAINSGTASTNLTNNIPAGTVGSEKYTATSAPLTVTPSSGIVATKTINKQDGNGAFDGSNISFTITLNNYSATPANVTTLTDDLKTMAAAGYFTVGSTPAFSTTCTGATLTSAVGSTTATVSGGGIPARVGNTPGTCTLTIPLAISAITPQTTYTNTIPIGAIQTDQANNTVAVTGGINVYRAIYVAESYSPTTLQAGGTTVLTLVPENDSNSLSFTGMSFPVTLPSGLVIAPSPNVSSTCPGATITATPGASSFTVSGISLAALATCNIKVTTQVPAGTPPGTITTPIALVGGAVTTNEGATNRPNPETSSITVVNSAVSLSKSFTPATVALNTPTQLAIQFSNRSSGAVQLNGVTLTDSLPLNMTVATPANATFTGSGCFLGTLTATPGGTSVKVSGASIAVNSICTLQVNVVSNAVGNLDNDIPVGALTTTQGISNVSPASATLSVAGTADISVTKTDAVTTLPTGTSTTYTIVVRNAGPDNVAGITVSDPVPSGMTFTSWTCTASAGAACDAASGSGAINEQVTVNVGATVTYTVTAALAANYAGTTVANTATVTQPGTVADPNSANNTATDTDSVGQGVVLALTKTDGSTTYTPGGTATYTITVANTGQASATQVNVTDSLPSGVTLNGTVTCSASGTAACGTVSGSSGQTSFGATNAVVPSGAANKLTFTVPVSFSSTLTTSPLVNTVSAADAPSGATGSASDSDTLGSVADVSVVKAGPASVTAGSPITYTLTVSNAGPSSANGTTFNDVVPAAITGVTASCGSAAGGAVCPASVNVSGNTVSGAVPTLPPNSSVVVTITGTTSASSNGAPLTNTATVAPPAGATDPTSANNTSTVTTAQSNQADLSITKTDGKAGYVAGTTNTYTIVVANAGPSDASNLNISDVAPASLTGVTVTCVASGTANCGTNASSANTLSFTGGSVNAGAANFLTLTVNGTVDPAATTNVVNTATVSVPAGANYTDPSLGNNTATDTDTPLPQQVDLAITKTDNQTSYVPGAPITYTIVVTNAGPSTATGFSVADAVPASITGVSVSCAVTGVGNCGSNASAGNNLSFTNASLNPGAGSNALTFTVSGTVSASTSGDLTNTATVTAGTGATENNTANNTATDTDIQGVASADLAITKDDGQATYVAGSPVSYTIKVTNNGPSNAPNLDVKDVVPANITGVTVTCTPTGAGNSCGTNASAGNTVSYTGASLNAGSGNVLTLTVQGTISPSATGNLVNTAAVVVPAGATYTDPDLANNNATDTDAPAGAVVDLAITKTDNQTTYVAGAPITYILVVTNGGPSLASGFTVSDAVPAAITGVTVTCAVTGTGNCGTNGSTGNAVSFTNATLSPGAGNSLTLTVSGTVTASTTGSLANTATVTAGVGSVDSDLTNNSATDTDTQGPGVADLSIVKDDGSATYVAGTPITYQITVKNNGPSNAPSFSIDDAITAQIGGVTIACAVGTGTGSCGTNASSGNTLSFTGASLTVGSTLVLTVSGTIDPAATGNLVNTATVTVPQGVGYTDPDPTNNASTDTDTTTPQQIDLAITKTDNQTSYVPGTPITYTIVVTNAGPSTASGFSVADAVPAAITGVSVTCAATGAGNSCGSNASAGNTVSFTNATLNPGAGNNLTWTVSGTISASATGDLSNTATVTAGSGSTEANVTNNSAADTDTQSAPQVDLAITKTDNQTSYVPGAPITYTIVVTNAGPSTATGFGVADTVPAAITGVTVTCAPTGAGNSCGSNASAGNTLSFTNATLNPGAGNSLTLTVSGTVSASATGDLVNTAAVTAGNGSTDTNPANNSATDTDTQGTPQVDLAITKTDGQTSYVPGAPITYTIVVTNAGPSTATEFSVADAMPAAITGVTVTCIPAGAGNSCGSSATTGNNVSFTNATLSAGAGNNLTLTVSGTVSASATGDLVNTATVTVGSGATDTMAANNSATDTDTQGTAQVDLAIVKVGPGSAKPGDAIQYTLTVSNTGQADATGFSIADIVPGAVTVSSVNCAVTGTGSCGTNGSVGNNVSFTNAQLSAGAGNVLTITISGHIAANATGSVVNTATVTAGAGAVDVSTNNNSSAATTSLTPLQPPVPAPTLSWGLLMGLILLLLGISYAQLQRRRN